MSHIIFCILTDCLKQNPDGLLHRRPRHQVANMMHRPPCSSRGISAIAMCGKLADPKREAKSQLEVGKRTTRLKYRRSTPWSCSEHTYLRKESIHRQDWLFAPPYRDELVLSTQQRPLHRQFHSLQLVHRSYGQFGDPREFQIYSLMSINLEPTSNFLRIDATTTLTCHFDDLNGNQVAQTAITLQIYHRTLPLRLIMCTFLCLQCLPGRTCAQQLRHSSERPPLLLRLLVTRSSHHRASLR